MVGEKLEQRRQWMDERLTPMILYPAKYQETGSALEARLIPSDNVVIRWGYTGKIKQGLRVINKAHTIRLAADKPRAYEVIKRAGIPVPPDDPIRFPVIGRTPHHEAGNGLWYCENVADISWAYFGGARMFMAYYPKTKEYRVHVMRGEAFYTQEKIGNPAHVAWNRQNGFTMELSKDTPDTVIQSAIAAVQALGLDFGAVDVGYNAGIVPDRVVFEVNTAPRLGKRGLRLYADKLNAIINEQQGEVRKP